MSATMLCRERDSLNAAAIPPSSLNGTYNTGGIDMSVFERGQFFISWGDATGSTINAALYQGNSADGSGKVAVTNGLSSSYNTLNGTMTMELRSDQMFARYLFCQVVVATVALLTSVTPVGTVARFRPANSFDNSKVATRFAGYPGGPQY